MKIQDAALIEDFFSVNTEEIVVSPSSAPTNLIDPFCITGPSVFEFDLATSVSLLESVFEIVLMINDLPVARAAAEDFNTTASLSLVYRGLIDEESEVKVVAIQNDEIETVTIGENQ